MTRGGVYMWEYNYTIQNDELMHYGIPGMRWGHRKARPIKGGQSSSAAYLRMQKAKSNKKIASRSFNSAYRHDRSLIRRSQFDKADNKRSSQELMKAAQKSNKADMEYKKAKKAYKSVKKHEKQKVKDMKAKYSKEYLSGKSPASQAISKMLGTDKNYANIMYDMEKRGKVNKKWRD